MYGRLIKIANKAENNKKSKKDELFYIQRAF